MHVRDKQIGSWLECIALLTSTVLDCMHHSMPALTMNVTIYTSLASTP
jgi:hypothetical protein